MEIQAGILGVAGSKTAVGRVGQPRRAHAGAAARGRPSTSRAESPWLAETLGVKAAASAAAARRELQVVRAQQGLFFGRLHLELRQSVQNAGDSKSALER